MAMQSSANLSLQDLLKISAASLVEFIAVTHASILAASRHTYAVSYFTSHWMFGADSCATDERRQCTIQAPLRRFWC